MQVTQSQARPPFGQKIVTLPWLGRHHHHREVRLWLKQPLQLALHQAIVYVAN